MTEDEYRERVSRIGEHAQTATEKMNALRAATDDALAAYDNYLKMIKESQ